MCVCVYQDDYLDCYGDPAVTGKVGTDIEENKCCWLVIQALKLASPEQRKTLEVRIFGTIVKSFLLYINSLTHTFRRTMLVRTLPVSKE